MADTRPCGASEDVSSPCTSIDHIELEMPTVTASATIQGSKSRAGKGMVITFKDMNYIVRNSSNKKKDLYLLKGISGYMRPGQLCALMGPSGSGKTTLLDVLAGRKTVGRLEGEVLFGGAKPTSGFLRRYTGYVEQFDSLLPNLTVHEMLMYTAELKRPLKESIADKRQAVEEVLQELALTKCRDTRIGNVMERGISGGQSKRVNIGISLITQPRVLFLDEPTSGLDSFTASEVMTYVKALAQDGITVCATIHSPTAYAFSLFDRLMLLLQGRVVYFGNNDGAPAEYFRALLQQLPAMDGMAQEQDNKAEWIVDLTTKGDREGLAGKFADAYDASPEREVALRELDELACKDCAIDQSMLDALRVKRATVTPSWWALWTLLRYRTLRDYQDPKWLGPRVADKLMFSIIILTLFWGVGDTNDPSKYMTVAAVLFMNVVLPAFGAAAYTSTLVLERPLFIRERQDGLYRPITYLTYKMLGELVMATAISALACCFVWFAVQLRGSFLVFWLAYLLTLAFGIVLAYGIAAVSPNLEVANTALPAYVVTLLLFAGFLLPRDDIPGYWLWYSTINALRYAWGANMKNQFGDCCTEEYLGGQSILNYYDLSGINPYAWLAIEAGFVAVFFVVAWAALSFVKHQKR